MNNLEEAILLMQEVVREQHRMIEANAIATNKLLHAIEIAAAYIPNENHKEQARALVDEALKVLAEAYSGRK